MAVSIDAIEKRGQTTYIRCGANEIEIPGGDAALSAWVADNLSRVDSHVVIATAMAEHRKADPELRNLSGLLNRDINVALTSAPKAVKNG